MRIVFVAWEGSVHTRRWAAFFAGRGHEVHVVTCGGLDAGEQARSYAVHDLGRPWPGKFGYLLKLRMARRVIRALNPDVVHAHYATSYGLLARASGFHPLVVTAHGDDVLIAPRNPIKRFVVRRVLRSADLITVPAPHMRDAVLALVAPDSPDVSVFQYGVDATRLAQLGHSIREAGSATAGQMIRLVSARPLLKLYRIDAIIEAVALLRADDTPVVLDILGDGAQRASLERLAADRALGAAVAFHGQVPEHELERIVAGANVYVSTSTSDGVSIALLEAMALGSIPVLSDIPANRNWVRNGITGALVEIDPSSIADGIRTALDLDRDRVAAINAAIVGERADRDTNLGALEILIDSLSGVTFDSRPAPSRTDAA